MKPKIAILAPKHFCDYLKKMSTFYHMDFEEKCELSYHEFELFAELSGLYEQIWDQYDGFCVAGNFTKQIILQKGKSKLKPLESISARSTEYYKAFFELLKQNRETDLSRVFIDTYLWGGDKVPKTVEEFTKTDWLLVDLRNVLLSEMSIEEIMNIEKRALKKAKTLWDENAADLILCRQTTIYPLLKEAGIPCSFVYPSADGLLDALSLLIGKIRLNQAEAELPAVIYVTSDELQKDVMSGISTNHLNLQKAILEFDQSNTTGFVTKQAMNGYEIYTTKQVVKNITENFTVCQLQKFILSRLGMNVQIGYGIGQTVMRARYNALEACTVAKRGNDSYLMTADGSLIGPLDEKNVLKVSGNVNVRVLTAAKQSKLSISTIQRIISVTELLGTDELTVQELSQALQVTVANANRFMNALVKSGFAEITSEKKSYSKGRPSRVYKLLLNKTPELSEETETNHQEMP